MLQKTALCLLLALSPLLASAERAVSEQQQDHYRNGLFFNPLRPELDKSFFSYLNMRWFSGVEHADQRLDAHKVSIADQAVDSLAADFDLPQLTWLGHSTFLIQYRGKTVLTDPMLSQRASPFSFVGPDRLVAKPIALADLPPIDVVIISHNHYDHLDQDTISQLGNAPLYLVPLGLKRWFIEQGIAPGQVVELDWWQSHQARGIALTATPSQHWSGRGLFDRMETLWAAWHIDIDGFTVWFAGDTGYNAEQFKAVGERWQGVDIGLIPIGGYSPRWFMESVHVDPAQAIQIHRDIGARVSIGMHWGTFQMTSEPMMEPKQLLEQQLAAEQLSADAFITLAIGESRRWPQLAAPARQPTPSLVKTAF